MLCAGGCALYISVARVQDLKALDVSLLTADAGHDSFQSRHRASEQGACSQTALQSKGGLKVGWNKYFRYSMFAMFAGMALTLFDLRLS